MTIQKTHFADDATLKRIAALEAEIQQWRDVTARKDPEDCRHGIQELYDRWQSEKAKVADLEAENAALRDQLRDRNSLALPAHGVHFRRIEDMSTLGYLEVFREEDGDIIVTSYGMQDDILHGASVQFCIPGSGGGRSPCTHQALLELMRAIEQDNKERPIMPARKENP